MANVATAKETTKPRKRHAPSNNTSWRSNVYTIHLHKIPITPQNCRNNQNVMLSLLGSSFLTIDIVTIQEPFIKPDTNSLWSLVSVFHGSLERLIPASPNPPRTITYITTSNPYLQCQPRPDIINDQDVLALEIRTHSITPIALLNIYDEQIQASLQQPNTSNKHSIEGTITDLPLPTRCIMAGDWNGHHSLWDSRGRNPKRHEALLELIDNIKLTLING